MTVNYPGGQEADGTDKVCCLIGSSRFKAQFHELGERLEKQGWLVLMMTFFQHADNRPVSDGERAVLEVVDQRRIDLCREVWVVNPGGYVGESTRREIAYAILHGKTVWYLYPNTEGV